MGIDGRAEGDDGSTLSPAVQSVIGWVVREGTTNVLRHGDARSCVIRLWVPPAGPAVLTMENDGAAGSVHSAVSGPSASGPPGSGLTGLRERVGALGGTLTAEPETGGIFVFKRARIRAGGPEFRWGTGGGATTRRRLC
ncbi:MULTISPECIES: hypothetical protein [unclassified Streptomyces]|uniref:sensor histidine kinase n=1 Tax=unclassified Streptomyces TaxID=2593676 RepID=UPI0032D590E2